MENRGLSLDLQLTHDGPLHCNNHRKLRKLVSKSRPFDLTRTTRKFGSFFTFIFIFSYYTTGTGPRSPCRPGILTGVASSPIVLNFTHKYSLSRIQEWQCPSIIKKPSPPLSPLTCPPVPGNNSNCISYNCHGTPQRQQCTSASPQDLPRQLQIV